MLVPGNDYGVIPGSPAHHRVLWEIRKEVAALLSPVCATHPNIVRLIGVVVDSLQRPVKLLFEYADHGDLTRWVQALQLLCRSWGLSPFVVLGRDLFSHGFMWCCPSSGGGA
jgi:hypothetical protein